MSNNESDNTNDEISAYDSNADGQISLSESVRATLGIVDARLEQVAAQGGAKGKIADAAHKVADKLDND
jgi:hypothetical protein